VRSREDREKWCGFNKILTVLVRRRLFVVSELGIGFAPRCLFFTSVVLLRKERLLFCENAIAAFRTEEGGEHIAR